MSKVLLGFHMADEETGVYIKHGFEELGWEVIECCPRTRPPAHVTAMAQFYRPDLILLSREVAFNAHIDNIKRYAPTVCWSLDVWDSVEMWEPWFPLYSKVNGFFTIAKSYIPRYKELLGHENVFWLSEACDPQVHRKYSQFELAKEELREFSCDVGFVGSIEGEHPQGKFRRELIEELDRQGFEVKLWGGGDRAIRYLKNRDLAKMSSVAKIVLCASGWPEVELSQSARIYRHLGAGAFCLEIAVKGIENWFEVGKEIDIYKNINDCVEKVRYYLDNPNKRKEIAEHGYKICHEKHEFSHRIVAMLEILKEKGIMK